MSSFENPGERVVVAGRDGIKLVIVATRTGHRKPLCATHYHVDAVINDVMRDAEKTPAQGEKTHCREMRRTLRFHLIRRELEQEKAIIRHVLIQRSHHPVAIRPGMDELLFLACVNVALCV